MDWASWITIVLLLLVDLWVLWGWDTNPEIKLRGLSYAFAIAGILASFIKVNHPKLISFLISLVGLLFTFIS